MFENITAFSKNEFYNEIEKEFPEAFKKFSAWMDEYKKQVGWKKLFNEGISLPAEQGMAGEDVKAPKFHELPVDMQYGVLLRFYSETVNPEGAATVQAKATNVRFLFRTIETYIIHKINPKPDAKKNNKR